MTDSPQLTRADLAGLSAAQIDAARLAGQLDGLLGRRTEPEQYTAEQYEAMTPEEIAEATAAGHLRTYMTVNGIEDPRPVPGVPAGPRGSRIEGGQLSRADLQRMSPTAINAAREAGHLDRLLGRAR